jgi:hypothetical protein
MTQLLNDSINVMNPINPINLSREMRSLFHWDPINPKSKETNYTINVYKRQKGVFYRVEVNREKREKDFHFFNDGESTEIRNLI